MAYHLVAHRRLLTDQARYQRWRDALARQHIRIDGVFDLAQSDWHHALAHAINDGDRVLALGGDGTLSSVAHQCVAHGWPLAILPAGTANDFARGLGLPFQPDQACRILQHGALQRVDVGRLNGRLFLNVAHIGLGAEVAWSLHHGHKRFWGAFSYLRRLLKLLSGKRRFSARIEADGEVLVGRWLEIALANGRYFGGGHLIEGAGLENGTLTLVAIRARPIPKVIIAWIMARLGRPLDRKLVRVEHVQQCRVTTRRRLKMTADGERFGRTPAQYVIEPQALQVVLPVTEPINDSNQGQEDRRVLDQQHDVMLYGISGRGAELVDRYRDLAELEALAPSAAGELQQLAAEREQLMDAFRQEVIEEGGLPKAGNPDREFIESLADRWLSSLTGTRTAFERLQQAEQEWLDDIVTLSQESWPDPLAQLLIRLSQHGHHCQQRLQWLADHSQ